MVWLNVTESRKRYLAGHGYSLRAHLPTVIADLKVESRDLRVDERASSYGRTASAVVPLAGCIPQTCWRRAQKVRIETLGEAMSYLLKPLKRAAESGIGNSLRSREARKSFR